MRHCCATIHDCNLIIELEKRNCTLRHDTAHHCTTLHVTARTIRTVVAAVNCTGQHSSKKHLKLFSSFVEQQDWGRLRSELALFESAAVQCQIRSAPAVNRTRVVGSVTCARYRCSYRWQTDHRRSCRKLSGELRDEWSGITNDRW